MHTNTERQSYVPKRLAVSGRELGVLPNLHVTADQHTFTFNISSMLNYHFYSLGLVSMDMLVHMQALDAIQADDEGEQEPHAIARRRGADEYRHTSN